MPVANAPETETWQDWCPAGKLEIFDLLSRDEMLEEANAAGCSATVSNLNFWFRTGVLPKPVRRRHAGRVRATFPQWYPQLICRLRQLQGLGVESKDIAQRLRVWGEELVAERIAMGAYDGSAPPAMPETFLPPEAIEAFRRKADDIEIATGFPQQSVDIVFRDVTGGEHHYHVALR